MKRSLFTFLVLFFISGPTLAGGPWFVDSVTNTGEPAQWRYDSARGKWVVRWKMDPGTPLTIGRTSRSVSWFVENYINPMLSDWQNVQLPYNSAGDFVQTTAILFEHAGEVEEDITVSNYQSYALTPDPARPPPTVVIFDVDGSIIEDYCIQSGGSAEECAESRNRIVGMGKPFLSASTKRIKHGFIFLNGRLINGDANDGAEMDPEGFKAVIKHEFGHLLNLDHSQVNATLAEACDGDACDGGTGVGTMFPAYKTLEQGSLHRDDKVAISWLYPSQDFLSKFCFIVGEVQNEEGKGIQGVNVIAQSVANPIVDARSMVSGVLYPAGTENGQYVLSGIIPGEDYTVTYEELLKKYNDQMGSEFGPLGASSPTGFGSGTIQGPDRGATVHCGAGGEQIEMPVLKLSLSEGRALSGAVNEEEGSGATQEKKGWLCQFSPTQPLTRDDFWMIGVFLCAGLYLFLRFYFPFWPTRNNLPRSR